MSIIDLRETDRQDKTDMWGRAGVANGAYTLDDAKAGRNTRDDNVLLVLKQVLEQRQFHTDILKLTVIVKLLA